MTLHTWLKRLGVIQEWGVVMMFTQPATDLCNPKLGLEIKGAPWDKTKMYTVSVRPILLSAFSLLCVGYQNPAQPKDAYDRMIQVKKKEKRKEKEKKCKCIAERSSSIL